jgi:hypothetical protein
MKIVLHYLLIVVTPAEATDDPWDKFIIELLEYELLG